MKSSLENVSQKTIIKSFCRFFSFFPCIIHWLAILALLWYPFIHFVRFVLTPKGMIYTGVEGTDLALFIWTMNSPYVDFLALRDLESDVNIFFRADYMSLLLIPFAIITSFFKLSGEIGYTIVLCFWNAINVYATYYFYFAFFQNSRISSLAAYLSYLLSGISGLIVVSNWLLSFIFSGEFRSGLDLADWVGENHKISNEFADGNAIITLTNMSRAHYLAPRAFGLFAISFFHLEVLNFYRRLSRLVASLILMMLCAVIHPASGLVYLMMFLTLIAFYAFQEDKNLAPRSFRFFFFPFFGFILATIYWQVYRNLPESKKLVESYLQILHNTDSVPLLLATLPTIGFVLLCLFRAINRFLLALLFLAAAFFWMLGISEFFIRDYSVSLRAVLLFLSALCISIFLLLSRRHLAQMLRDAHLKYGFLMFIWALAAILIASSPHHDIRTVLYASESDSKIIEILRHLSDLGKAVFAARFKLGIWIPLIGSFAFFAYRLSSKMRAVLLVCVFLVTLPSTIIYLYLTTSQGRILEEEHAAFSFLKTQRGRNVMCSPETGVFLPNLALKRCFGPGAADPNWKIHDEDVKNFYQTSSDSLRGLIIKKYRIDFVVLGKNERLFGVNDFSFASYQKIFEQGDIIIYQIEK